MIYLTSELLQYFRIFFPENCDPDLNLTLPGPLLACLHFYLGTSIYVEE